VSRIPVCRACLECPAPFEPEYFCIRCGTPFLNGFPLDQEGRCALCRSGLRGYDGTFCYGSYEGTLRELIHLLKYSRIQPLARPLAGHLLRALPRNESFDMIVPVPLHWRRRWQRGFNQSELLAREVARHTGIPVHSVLRRARATAPQAGLTSAKRRANVLHVFQVKGAGACSGRRILLIDDVLTTGATAASCAAVLKRAGASRVCVLTIARADRRWNASSLGDGVYGAEGAN
jgi:ComF family protein